jgi:predicted Zn-dependent protease with MMP-like domain
MADRSTPVPAAGDSRPPSADDIVRIGEAILGLLPDELRRLVAHLPIAVHDWPSEELLLSMEIEDPLQLTGLFHGIPVGERDSMGLPPDEPEMVYLFRMPILFEWCERGCRLEEVVFDVLTHEIGHAFGMDEAQVLRLEGRLE